MSEDLIQDRSRHQIAIRPAVSLTLSQEDVRLLKSVISHYWASLYKPHEGLASLHARLCDAEVTEPTTAENSTGA
jgi:hypothetical protein